MTMYYYYYLCKMLFYYNFLFLFCSFFLALVIYFLFSTKYFQTFIAAAAAHIWLHFYLLFCFVVSFFIFLLSFFVYVYFVKLTVDETACNSYSFFLTLTCDSSLNYYFSFDLFGLVLLFLAYSVGLITLLTLDTRFYWKNIKFSFSIQFFTIIVYLYVSAQNILLFFLYYELLLIPSVFVVYFVSTSRKAIQACLYFVIWTQLGSFIVLGVISYIIIRTNNMLFLSISLFNFSNLELILIYVCFFIGFGFKVPIWPFHYWLTKTHVEAPSGFSIYLSGFLVKSAVFGFYKLTGILGTTLDTEFCFAIAFLGVIDASIKMWGQNDLKKLVAYGTIQEMNLIYSSFCLGDTYAVMIGIFFSATHAFLSAMMFFLVDCIYRRYHTRSVTELSGVLNFHPNAGICILLMIVFFAGLPGTIKFTCEFYLFSGLIAGAPLSTFSLILAANVCGLIGFSKSWFNITFGMNPKCYAILSTDLTLKELAISGYCFFFLIFFSFFSCIFF